MWSISFLHVDHSSRAQPFSHINRLEKCRYSCLYITFISWWGRELERLHEEKEGRKGECCYHTNTCSVWELGSLLPFPSDVFNFLLQSKYNKLSITFRKLKTTSAEAILQLWGGLKWRMFIKFTWLTGKTGMHCVAKYYPHWLWKTSYADLARLCKHKATLSTKT